MKEAKKAQVTLFIIIAVVIVGIIGTLAYFQFKPGKIPTKFEPIEQYFIDCIKFRAEEGAGVLGQRGGYIQLPNFEPGSLEWPTSNHLGFMGDSVPFWLYVSNNGVLKEQVPTINSMEEQLSNYLEENLPLCDFSEFLDRGYDVTLNVGDITADIRESKITFDINADLEVGLDNETARISSHDTEITSNLGKMFSSAVKIFNKEKKEMFLENYTIDMLYLYAPTTDSEVTCSPTAWLLSNVTEDLKGAFESNFLFISQEARDKYFLVDLGVEEDVRFLYSRDWPTKVYTPNDNGMLIAKPVGNQQGLGALGFCITSYHFVYDINFPILVQIYDSEEFFQFPLNIIVRGNKPREPVPGSALEIGESSCKYKTTYGRVSTFDVNLNPIEADVNFKCFTDSCSMGQTVISGEEAVLEALFPQCINGFVTARKEGYLESKEIVSSNNEFDAVLILEKLSPLNVNIKFTGSTPAGSTVIIYFESEKDSRAVYWPDQKTVELAEGYYNITAYVYSASSINLPEAKTRECVDVPEPGLLGFFGKTNEKCFDNVIPAQKLSNVVIGGGRAANEYFLSSQLEDGDFIDITLPETKVPTSIEEIQITYENAEINELGVNIR